MVGVLLGGKCSFRLYRLLVDVDDEYENVMGGHMITKFVGKDDGKMLTKNTGGIFFVYDRTTCH